MPAAFPPKAKWELILLAIEDVTDRKRVEVEREGLLHDAKEARVRAETCSQLADADRRKNEFLAMLAHELRNPLAAIRNAVDVPLTRARRKTSNGAATSPIARSRNFARLINDLFDVSRITEGKILLRKEVIDATAVIGQAIEAVKPMVEERKQELLVSYTSSDLKLEADPTRLEQILVNLLTNAAKYTPTGGRIQLTVGVEGNEMVFRVRDNGLGIPPEMLPQMFELFTQGDRSLDRSEGGLGIGLTLVK